MPSGVTIGVPHVPRYTCLEITLEFVFVFSSWLSKAKQFLPCSRHEPASSRPLGWTFVGLMVIIIKTFLDTTTLWFRLFLMMLFFPFRFWFSDYYMDVATSGFYCIIVCAIVIFLYIYYDVGARFDSGTQASGWVVMPLLIPPCVWHEEN